MKALKLILICLLSCSGEEVLSKQKFKINKGDSRIEGDKVLLKEQINPDARIALSKKHRPLIPTNVVPVTIIGIKPKKKIVPAQNAVPSNHRQYSVHPVPVEAKPVFKPRKYRPQRKEPSKPAFFIEKCISDDDVEKKPADIPHTIIVQVPKIEDKPSGEVKIRPNKDVDEEKVPEKCVDIPSTTINKEPKVESNHKPLNVSSIPDKGIKDEKIEKKSDDIANTTVENVSLKEIEGHPQTNHESKVNLTSLATTNHSNEKCKAEEVKNSSILVTKPIIADCKPKQDQITSDSKNISCQNTDKIAINIIRKKLPDLFQYLLDDKDILEANNKRGSKKTDDDDISILLLKSTQNSPISNVTGVCFRISGKNDAIDSIQMKNKSYIEMTEKNHVPKDEHVNVHHQKGTVNNNQVCTLGETPLKINENVNFPYTTPMNLQENFPDTPTPYFVTSYSSNCESEYTYINPPYTPIENTNTYTFETNDKDTFKTKTIEENGKKTTFKIWANTQIFIQAEKNDNTCAESEPISEIDFNTDECGVNNHNYNQPPMYSNYYHYDRPTNSYYYQNQDYQGNPYYQSPTFSQPSCINYYYNNGLLPQAYLL